ncbi:two-component regulator propeller domain-containing protein [Pukyongiella litopenaei]|uniref:Uncharacterized protein n=1 Tax=Pukyongiella litopenaei TaxID=2605946 RepID=A0A2S0MKE2_9RHOB|nr:two-component regulator propeller domain-containing protein [Pukyongiella litopenaei]AVO36355.1 hypothetical protein C6Y53_00600 [Pukyongiella litopenaei]
MAAEDAIRDLLPTLWRPEPGAEGLLPNLIRVTGAGLSRARIDAGNTMQAHWSRFGDYAPISPFVAAFRKEAGLPVLLPADAEVEAHPYLDDLARLAGLLALVPYTDPAAARETVEQFRRRVLGTVALWRGGVSTPAALRQAARLALSGTPERAVSVEEFAPGATLSQTAATRGSPGGLVGPLMRWRIDASTLAPVPPEIFIEGATPEPGRIDIADHPVIERFDPATGTGIGILYNGVVEPGQVLALRPTYSSWLGGETGLRRAMSLPDDMPDDIPANPTALGPWAAAAGAPAGHVAALATGPDGALWAAVNDAGDGQLWQLTASGWTQAFSGLPVLRCLLADGITLLLGHGNGLARLTVFGSPPTLAPDPATATGAAVHALARAGDGTIWAATATGAATIGPGDTLVAVGPGARAETETALAAVLAEPDGIVTLGGAAGLFRFDARAGTWHVYRGDSLDETVPDWLPWDAASDALPADEDVFLPPVTALLRGPDTLLWIGTEYGLAAWGAHRIRNTYATRLRAFPALGTGTIHALAQDERGRIWAGTDRGLLVHDGVDWFEADTALTRLPRPAPEDPGSGWRFDRTGGAWQFAGATGTGFAAQSPAVITADNAAVTALHWTDGAEARLGTLTGDGFAVDGGATPAALRLRVKPSPDRIAEGGLPAIPRLAPGMTHWRYLREEEPAPPAPSSFPAWTREGRLLTPPAERTAPWEGRYLSSKERAMLDQVFAFNPAARVTFRWQPRAPFSITVRLDRPDPAETLPGAVLDRVFEAADRVRPAAAQLRLAFGDPVVRGD